MAKPRIRQPAVERLAGGSFPPRAPAPVETDAPSAAIVNRKYRRNFLAQVIARIDFAAPIAISSGGPPATVINAFKKQFPIPEPRKVLESAILIEEGGARHASRENQQWFYHGKDREKVVHITDSCMYVEYKKYKSYEQLRTEFLAIVNALFDTFDNLQVQRLGLRYIDKIEFDEKDPTEWSKYLSADLLSIFRLADEQRTISRAFHVLDLNYGDYSLRFQYGMWNPDYPVPIRKKIFTLDWDAYCTLLLGRDEIAKTLDTFRTKLKIAFEQVITDGLRKKMGGLRG